MQYFDWDKEKNNKLKEEREISFEEIIEAMNNGELLDVTDNPNKKYKGQKIFVVNLNDYIFLVPFVENEKGVFLKTIFPSRKATKKYLIKKGGKNDEIL